MSAMTLVFHLSHLQRGNFDLTPTLIRGTELAPLPFGELFRVAAWIPGHRTVYQCAAGTWNHNFFEELVNWHWASILHQKMQMQEALEEGSEL
jgi:hypothetical protein